MSKSIIKRLAGLAAAALAVAVLAGPAAQAQNPQPANKTAAIGNTIDDLGPNEDHVVLSEIMKVSSPADLILNVSSECSILTHLVTANQQESDTQEGTVNIYVTIDGKRVPVAGSSTGNGDPGDVVFCNRAYSRTVTDEEDPLDGIDRESDYIGSRTANAFQWLALNTGVYYDESVIKNGNNILQIDVHAVYDDSNTAAETPNTIACTGSETTGCSRAYVGKRTLIVEPTKASVIETTATSGGGS
jgi:hypothetical protein